IAHRDVEQPVRLARVVDRHDVRVVERRRALGLADEALAEGMVLGKLGLKDLQRDLALQVTVAREVDLAHSAAANQAVYVVGPKRVRAPILLPGCRKSNAPGKAVVSDSG